MLTIGLVVMVIFLFLRNVSATIIPSLALPHVHRRHIRGDVPAGLHARQPVADGADAFGRLRGGRRHRDAGKHRPPHGNGRRRRMEAALEGSREIGFTIHLDDAVAGGRVHSGAVHGRHYRTPAARVRGDHQRGDSGFRLRLADADADAVQPLPAQPPWQKHGRFYQASRAILRRFAARLRPTLKIVLRHSFVTHDGFVRRVGRDGLPVHGGSERLHPDEDTGQLFASPKPPRASRSKT